jgi:hypothetical protein
MFQLDNHFLDEIGLADLPDEQKGLFLQHVYDQLEHRVGVELYDGINDEQLDEFESIMDNKPQVIEAWIMNNAPNFADDPLFNKIQASSGLAVNDPRLKAEYAATKWLEINRPNYREVVAKTFANLKQEITQNRDAILGSASNQQ